MTSSWKGKQIQGEIDDSAYTQIHTLIYTLAHTRQQLWHCRQLGKGWTNIEAVALPLKPYLLPVPLPAASRFTIFTDLD